MTEQEDAVDLLYRAAECVDEGENSRALANMQAAASLITYEDVKKHDNPRMVPFGNPDESPDRPV